MVPCSCLLGRGKGAFFRVFSAFVVLFLYFVGPVCYCDHLLREEGAGCFATNWFVTYYCHHENIPV